MDAALYATTGLLIVATISGLSFLSVQFPETFKTFYRVGTILAILALFTFTIFDLGVRIGGKAAIELAVPAKVAAATAAWRGAQIPILAYFAITVLGLILVVLNFVSERIQREKEEVERRRKRGE